MQGSYAGVNLTARFAAVPAPYPVLYPSEGDGTRSAFGSVSSFWSWGLLAHQSHRFPYLLWSGIPNRHTCFHAPNANVVTSWDITTCFPEAVLRVGRRRQDEAVS
jgi:hypothetical protein